MLSEIGLEVHNRECLLEKSKTLGVISCLRDIHKNRENSVLIGRIDKIYPLTKKSDSCNRDQLRLILREVNADGNYGRHFLAVFFNEIAVQIDSARFNRGDRLVFKEPCLFPYSTYRPKLLLHNLYVQIGLGDKPLSPTVWFDRKSKEKDMRESRDKPAKSSKNKTSKATARIQATDVRTREVPSSVIRDVEGENGSNEIKTSVGENVKGNKSKENTRLKTATRSQSMNNSTNVQCEKTVQKNEVTKHFDMVNKENSVMISENIKIKSTTDVSGNDQVKNYNTKKKSTQKSVQKSLSSTEKGMKTVKKSSLEKIPVASSGDEDEDNASKGNNCSTKQKNLTTLTDDSKILQVVATTSKAQQKSLSSTEKGMKTVKKSSLEKIPVASSGDEVEDNATKGNNCSTKQKNLTTLTDDSKILQVVATTSKAQVSTLTKKTVNKEIAEVGMPSTSKCGISEVSYGHIHLNSVYPYDAKLFMNLSVVLNDVTQSKHFNLFFNNKNSKSSDSSSKSKKAENDNIHSEKKRVSEFSPELKNQSPKSDASSQDSSSRSKKTENNINSEKKRVSESSPELKNQSPKNNANSRDSSSRNKKAENNINSERKRVSESSPELKNQSPKSDASSQDSSSRSKKAENNINSERKRVSESSPELKNQSPKSDDSSHDIVKMAHTSPSQLKKQSRQSNNNSGPVNTVNKAYSPSPLKLKKQSEQSNNSGLVDTVNKAYSPSPPNLKKQFEESNNNSVPVDTVNKANSPSPLTLKKQSGQSDNSSPVDSVNKMLNTFLPKLKKQSAQSHDSRSVTVNKVHAFIPRLNKNTAHSSRVLTEADDSDCGIASDSTIDLEGLLLSRRLAFKKAGRLSSNFNKKEQIKESSLPLNNSVPTAGKKTVKKTKTKKENNKRKINNNKQKNASGIKPSPKGNCGSTFTYGKRKLFSVEKMEYFLSDEEKEQQCSSVLSLFDKSIKNSSIESEILLEHSYSMLNKHVSIKDSNSCFETGAENNDNNNSDDDSDDGGSGGNNNSTTAPAIVNDCKVVKSHLANASFDKQTETTIKQCSRKDDKYVAKDNNKLNKDVSIKDSNSRVGTGAENNDNNSSDDDDDDDGGGGGNNNSLTATAIVNDECKVVKSQLANASCDEQTETTIKQCSQKDDQYVAKDNNKSVLEVIPLCSNDSRSDMVNLKIRNYGNDGSTATTSTSTTTSSSSTSPVISTHPSKPPRQVLIKSHGTTVTAAPRNDVHIDCEEIEIFSGGVKRKASAISSTSNSSNNSNSRKMLRFDYSLPRRTSSDKSQQTTSLMETDDDDDDDDDVYDWPKPIMKTSATPDNIAIVDHQYIDANCEFSIITGFVVGVRPHALGTLDLIIGHCMSTCGVQRYTNLIWVKNEEKDEPQCPACFRQGESRKVHLMFMFELSVMSVDGKVYPLLVFDRHAEYFLDCSIHDYIASKAKRILIHNTVESYMVNAKNGRGTSPKMKFCVCDNNGIKILIKDISSSHVGSV